MKNFFILFFGLAFLAGCTTSTHIDTLIVDKNATDTHFDMENYDSNRSIK